MRLFAFVHIRLSLSLWLDDNVHARIFAGEGPCIRVSACVIEDERGYASFCNDMVTSVFNSRRS